RGGHRRDDRRSRARLLLGPGVLRRAAPRAAPGRADPGAARLFRRGRLPQGGRRRVLPHRLARRPDGTRRLTKLAIAGEEAAMSGDSVTARYLREFDHPVLPFPESDYAKTWFAGRYLSRPVFFEAGELSGLERDLALVRSALGTLPERLYGGDL